MLSHLDKIDFELKNHDRDVLGDAYEYLIAQFASGAGKKAGEFYTPQQVSKILAKIVTNKKSKLKSVYDPTCGSGSLLLRVSKEVQDVSNFYGQELIKKFINENMMNISDSDNIENEFEKFWEDEKQIAYDKLCTEENLDCAKVRQVVDTYVYEERKPLKDDIAGTLLVKPKLLERKKIVPRVLDKIVQFVDKFYDL
ncbi:N-6 DNA methylase [Sulfurimonas sp.]|uniref:type I restriction endonuclease subunit R, EcoR124 family n=1 Tax=Sulfurimonas sp. TaxID=2022749 RepID=UPI0025F84EE3|nr:N-6 DNA methylase [Sulfurimonas sp.]